MERKIEVRHINLEVKAGFESFTKKFEQLLGRFEPSLLKDVATNPAGAQQRVEAAEGEDGLMLFGIQDHGALLNIYGAPRKAKQYVVGNPLVALAMTRHDIRAALYAPLRVLVFEDTDHSTRVEYDLPSSLFGQFGNAEVTAVGQSLDAKLGNLIKKAEAGAEKGQSHVAS